MRGVDYTFELMMEFCQEQLNMTDYQTEMEPVGTPQTQRSRLRMIFQKVIIHAAVVTYLVFATIEYINSRKVLLLQLLISELLRIHLTGDACKVDCDLTLCSPFGMLIFVSAATYVGLLYFSIIKPYFGNWIKTNIFKPIGRRAKSAFKIL